LNSTIRTTGLIATRNQQPFIKEAMESLGAEVDELLVVDDFSSVESRQEMEDHLPVNGRILLNDFQMGVSLSFNKGVEEARGDIILIQGGDDVTLSGRAAAHVLALTDPNTILSYSRPIVIGETGQQLSSETASEFRPPAMKARLSYLDYLFRVGNFVCAPSAAFRKSDFLKFGGFSNGVKFLQDFDLWLEFAANGNFALSAGPGVKYRKHGRNLSREGGQASGVNRMRFEAEYDFIIEKFLNGLSPIALRELVAESGLAASSDDGINRVLLGVAHPDEKVRRRAVARVFSLLEDPTLACELNERGLGMESLNMLSTMVDHSNWLQRDLLKRQIHFSGEDSSVRGAK
jgi:glycosyltransferase involved in cell wall biosynthesis